MILIHIFCIILKTKLQITNQTQQKAIVYMAKVGYIFMAEGYDSYSSDKEWMENYGCCRIVEENPANEKVRPEWKTLLMSLERGDEIILSKFSNALRGTRELSFFLELCRIKVVRVISINDRIDSKDILFPDTKPSAVLEVVGSLPAEVAQLKKAPSHLKHLRQIKTKTSATKSRQGRETTIINMYNGGHSIEDIWHASGFKSKSSIFRILRKHGVTLNRGPHSGPIKKKNERGNNSSNPSSTL